ncbi:hypothetical protein COT49_02560 [candidate division WWE3 bacterium CG08_land_8_20_14_0_20_40_13]|uniref:Penicillin-binding protein 2 n=1 Tax=candidate division WWE3 bacterium CG08_land_8_20_14_0_20_40_13 TaxID=1975084 RepID=A0A2H0XDE0_UNCKA|nr:MAG: hypothetical protein COT49_02560 [candidate division WWE3 bacterium CG08_land_8_20_14_0_20_40_13]
MLLRHIDLRIFAAKIFFAILGFIIVARLFQIQVLSLDKYINIAKSQQNRRLSIPAMRGNIYFKDGAPFAISQISYFAFAEPKSLDKDKVNELISAIEKVSKPLPPEVKESLTKDLWFVPLVHGLSEEQKLSLEKEIPKGLFFRKEYQRLYPENGLGNTIVGVLGGDENGGQVGYWGVEGYYNMDLVGRSGTILAEVDAVGSPIIIGNYSEIPQVPGRSIVLSVDRFAEHLLEEKLRYYLDLYGAISASAVIIDPASGAIIAMADLTGQNKEDFNDVSEEKEEPAYINRVVGATYEPGSVFKALSMSAGIDTQSVTPETTFMDSGPKYYSGYKVDTWNGQHFGVESMYGVLEHSNNLGAAFVGEKVGAKKLWQYYKKFGIGQILGIDMEGEQTGRLRDWENWSDIDLVTAAFGQGVSATPLQVAMAFSVIANGGDLLKPFVAVLVGKEDARGIFENALSQNNRTVLSQVISLSSSNTMIDMLTKAAASGEAKYFVSKKYKVAGKTGTAQIPVPGGYDPDRTNATFVGFLPESRKFVMLVKFEEPTRSIFAAETAVPAWMDVAEELANYYRIPVDF